MRYSSYSNDPHGYRAAPPEPGPVQVTLGEEVRTVFAVLRRDWLVVAICTGLVMGLMLVYLVLTPAKYTASSELLLDPRHKQAINGEVVSSSFAVQSSLDTILLDSQVQVILSETVLRALIEQEGLMSDPEFAGSGGGLLAALQGGLSGGGADYADVQEAVRDALEVSRRTNTYILGIEFTTESAEKSARLANRLANIYIAQNSTSIADATSGTADALRSRLDELKAEANAANAAVETYRQENGLIGTQEMLVSEQQLRDINNQLSLAQVEANAAKSNLDRANSAIENGAITGDAALESEVVTQLQIDLSQLEAQQAQLGATYGSRHPQMTRIAEQKASLEAAIQAEYRRIAERLKQEYAAAQQREQTLRDQVAALESRTATSNSASVELRELQREAEASQVLYETYLRRTKEVQEQVDLPNDTARVISPAIPPGSKSEPKSMLLLAASAVVGAGLGVAVVWMRHILGGSAPLTAPDRSSRLRAGNDDMAAHQAPVRPRAFVSRPAPASSAPPHPVRQGPRPRAWQSAAPASRLWRQ